MLGTHNSFSYLPPRKWWMRLLHWTAKCQSKDIDAQIEAGAQVIDARVRLKDNDEWVFAHGPVEFTSPDGDNPFKILRRALRGGKVRCVRLIHEMGHTDAERDALFVKQAKFLAFLARSKGATVVCCRRKHDWSELVHLSPEPYTDQSAVGSMQSWYGKVWPWLWHRLHRRRCLYVVQSEQMKHSDALVLVDFL